MCEYLADGVSGGNYRDGFRWVARRKGVLLGRALRREGGVEGIRDGDLVVLVNILFATVVVVQFLLSSIPRGRYYSRLVPHQGLPEKSLQVQG